MVHKLSSQFTDFVLAKTKGNEDMASTILSEVGGALRQLGALNHPIPGLVVEQPTSKDFERALNRLVRFHKNIPSISDSEMRTALSIGNVKKDKIDNMLNNMYYFLDSLVSLGVSNRTRKFIEAFLKSWEPIVVESPEAIILKDVDRKPDQDTELPAFEQPALNRVEDRQIRRLDEQLASSAGLVSFMLKAGILEEEFGIQEIKTRLAERKFKWANLMYLAKERT